MAEMRVSYIYRKPDHRQPKYLLAHSQIHTEIDFEQRIAKHPTLPQQKATVYSPWSSTEAVRIGLLTFNLSTRGI